MRKRGEKRHKNSACVHTIGRMKINDCIKGKRFCFLGIGGASMSALAKYVLWQGGEVFGYDGAKNGYTAALEESGVKIYYGEGICAEEKAAINAADEIVATSAIDFSHPRVEECLAQGKEVTFRGAFLGKVARRFEKTIAFCGSHGKSTATGACAHIFAAANEEFCAHIGGEDLRFSNFYACGERYLLSEVCEYKKNLLHVYPQTAVLLNVDRDHMECYADEKDLISTFREFCERAEKVVFCADEANLEFRGRKNEIGFGIESEEADVRAKNVVSVGERYSFDLWVRGVFLRRIELNVIGRCHVYNALAAAAAALCNGIGADGVARGLESFCGIKRRFEKIGCADGTEWYADYAHHPREIAECLATARKLTNGRTVLIFQPHTYSRTKALFDEFASVLSGGADEVLLLKEYAAREAYDEKYGAEALKRTVNRADYADCFDEVERWIGEKAKRGDVVLFVGAGDIYERAKRALEKRRKNGKEKRNDALNREEFGADDVSET